MSPTKVTSILFVLTLAWGICAAQLNKYQEKCDVGKRQDGTEIDTCDKNAFLKCVDGRCQCADPKNQIWTFQWVKVNSRSKRSPKGGKGGGRGGFGKGVATGAIAGAAGGYLAGSIASSASRPSSTSYKKDKKERAFGCFSRVEGSCMLPNANGVNVIININKPAEAVTTTAAPANDTAEGSNSTAAANVTSPVAAPQISQQVPYEVAHLMLPKCVEHADCRPIPVKIVNGTVISEGSTDPRIGHCQCQKGYKADATDICVKDNGSGRTSGGILIAFLSVAITLMRNEYLKFL